MPPEPNRKMDELLKERARKRREEIGAPFELPPAARRMLQSEVARLVPQAPGKSRRWSFNLIGTLWTRVAVAGAFAAVLVLAALISIEMPSEKGSKKMALSKPESNVTQMTKLDLQTPEVKYSLAPDFQKPSAFFRLSATNQQPRAILETNLAVSLAVSRQPNSPAPLASAATTLYGIQAVPPQTLSDKAPSRQRYAQASVPRKVRASSAGAGSSILHSFEVEQIGSVVRIIDEDGSVYEGRLVSDATAVESRREISLGVREQSETWKTPTKTKEQPLASSDLKPNIVALEKASAPSAPKIAFQARGTNRSLKKLVVLQGSFLLHNQVSANTNLSFPSGATPPTLVQDRGVNTISLLQARIEGTAVIEGERPVPINALPVTR